MTHHTRHPNVCIMVNYSQCAPCNIPRRLHSHRRQHSHTPPAPYNHLHSHRQKREHHTGDIHSGTDPLHYHSPIDASTSPVADTATTGDTHLFPHRRHSHRQQQQQHAGDTCTDNYLPHPISPLSTSNSADITPLMRYLPNMSLCLMRPS